MFELTFIKKCNTQSYPVGAGLLHHEAGEIAKTQLLCVLHSLPRLEQKPWRPLSKLVRAPAEGTVLRSPLFSVRYAFFQFIEIERACIAVQPLLQGVAFNRALGRQLASERFDQRLIDPQKPRRQLVSAVRIRVCVFQCFGDTPIDRSLPRFKRTRVVGDELSAQLIRNWIAD